MGSVRADLGGRLNPETIDYFDLVPDALILLIFNRIGDVKTLGRCGGVSRRFQCLVPQVESVTVRVDCVISNDDGSATCASFAAATEYTRHPSMECTRHPFFSYFSHNFFSGISKPTRHPFFSYFSRNFFSGISKPFQSLAQFIIPSVRRIPSLSNSFSDNVVTHHSPSQVLKNFNEIMFLRIELPSGELDVGDGTLLKWKADFGSSLDSCVILGASSMIRNTNSTNSCLDAHDLDSTVNGNSSYHNAVEDDDGGIPQSFFTNGGLKLRIVWTISSLIAASGRHYLVQPIVAEHKTLEKLVLSDGDGQGVLSMNREQLEELRMKPLSPSSASNRTLVPDLKMRLWYAPNLELPNGVVLKGAVLVAVKPSEQPQKVVAGSEGNLVASVFEEPFRTAAKMLMKRRTYCLEMNSF